MQGEKNARVCVSWASRDDGVCRRRSIYNGEKMRWDREIVRHLHQVVRRLHGSVVGTPFKTETMVRKEVDHLKSESDRGLAA